MVRLLLVLASVGALALSVDAPASAQEQGCTQRSDQAAANSNDRNCPSAAAILVAGNGGEGCVQRSDQADVSSNARYCPGSGAAVRGANGGGEGHGQGHGQGLVRQGGDH
jgi:hypothetical protein